MSRWPNRTISRARASPPTSRSRAFPRSRFFLRVARALATDLARAIDRRARE
jgi:hypothetical protein